MSQMISLWTFACKLYNKTSVKNTCLQLQEDYAVNVPLLLTSCWVAEYGGVLSDAQVSMQQDLASQWHIQCIQPLRALRQNMKLEKLDAPTINSASWTLVREQVKTTELFAEQQLLQLLESSIRQQISLSAEKPLAIKLMAYDDKVYINHLLTTILRFVPILAESSESKVAVANIIASVVSEWPQIQYDAILDRVKQYSPVSE
jgi:uncharacterized protein (TIGR02444 family)